LRSAAYEHASPDWDCDICEGLPRPLTTWLFDSFAPRSYGVPCLAPSSTPCYCCYSARLSPLFVQLCGTGPLLLNKARASLYNTTPEHRSREPTDETDSSCSLCLRCECTTPQREKKNPSYRSPTRICSAVLPFDENFHRWQVAQLAPTPHGLTVVAGVAGTER
jgi:hypothetical protein